MARLSFDLSTPHARRWAFLAGASVLVLALHIGLLGWAAPAWFDTEAAPAAVPVLQVRSVVRLPAAPAMAAPAPAADAIATLPPLPPPRAATAARATASAPLAPKAAAAVTPLTDAEATTRADAPAPLTPPVAPPAMPESAAAVLSLAALAQSATELPVYATRLPSAGRWNYRLQRGLVSGEATLSWAPQGDARYEARLEGRVAGITMLDWVSRGAIDGAGIAPERFALRRRGRDQDAANFQRDAGKITFSGPTHELPLLRGVQDRLSWMLQLPAIVEADPAHYGPGTQIRLMVVGARGGAAVWAFKVVGPEALGSRSALKLVREAEHIHDTRAEVWLDPARGHLPLRAVLAQTEGGAALVLEMEP